MLHPPVLHRILERHRPSIAAAFVFPQLPQDTLDQSILGALALDGWKAVPRLARRGLQHLRAGVLASPPNYLSVAALFKHFDLPVHRWRNPNDAGCIQRLRQLSPDVVFNTQPWKLKADILAVPRLASINQHCGDLTKYRGVEPVLRAMLNGERTVEVTLHAMTADYDAGGVLASVPIEMGLSVFDTYVSAFDAVPALFDRALQRLANPVMPPPPSPLGKYYGVVTASERERFRALGLRYL